VAEAWIGYALLAAVVGSIVWANVSRRSELRRRAKLPPSEQQRIKDDERDFFFTW
jgi:hypothetical protein